LTPLGHADDCLALAFSSVPCRIKTLLQQSPVTANARTLTGSTVLWLKMADRSIRSSLLMVGLRIVHRVGCDTPNVSRPQLGSEQSKELVDVRPWPATDER
jgi:hypothetical protein